MAPMIPVIVTWLGPFGFADTIVRRFPSALGLTYPQLIAAGITIALYLVIFGQIVCKRIFGGQSSWSKAYSSTVSVFKSETENRTEVQNIRDEDPTSLEFQRLFRDIVRQIQKDGSCLVVVFDNIDRLPANQVIDLWAETRSIFATPAPTGSDPKSSVTAIMSYDHALISQALNSHLNIESNGVGRDALGSQVLAQSQESLDPAHELISKTFDITVRVSPPVSVDWRDHFNSLIGEAFDDRVLEDQKWRLFKLFETQRDLAGSYPTPRQIRAFLNDIGTLWTQWQTEIPIESIGFFVLVKNQIVGHPDALRSSAGIPYRLVQIANQVSWQQHLAALLFNVDLEKASQVLIGPQLRGALENEDERALEKLAETEIFEDTLADVVFGIAQNLNSGGEADTLSSVATSIAKLEVKPAVARYCWDLLIPTIQFLSDPGGIETVSKNHTSLALLVSNAPKPDATKVAASVIAWANKSLPPETERTRELGRTWAGFFEHVVSHIPNQESLANNTLFWLRNRVPSGSDFSLGAASVCASAAAADLSKLRFSSIDKVLTDGLKSVCSVYPEDVAVIATARPKWLTAPVANECAQVLIEHLKSIAFAEATHPSAIRALASLTLVPETKPLITKSLKNVEGDGTLLWHMATNLKSERARSAAACYYVYTIESGTPTIADSYAAHPIHGDMTEALTRVRTFLDSETPDENTLTELEDWIVKSQTFSTWLSYLLSGDAPAIVRAVVRKMVSSISPNRLYMADAYQKYDAVIEALGPEYTKPYLRFLSNWNAFVEDNFAGEKATSLPVNLLRDIEQYEIGDLSVVTETVDTYYKSLNSEELQTLLQETNAEASLLKYRVKDASLTLTAANIRPALVEIAMLVLTGEARPSESFGLLEVAYNSLTAPTQKKLVDTVFTRLATAPETRDGVVHLFDCMPSLAMSLPFSTRPNIALDKLFLHLVEMRTLEADAVLLELASTVKKCLKNANEDARRRIDEALQEERDIPEDSASTSDLRAAFGLAPLPDPTPDESGLEEVEEIEP